MDIGYTHTVIAPKEITKKKLLDNIRDDCKEMGITT